MKTNQILFISLFLGICAFSFFYLSAKFSQIFNKIKPYKIKIFVLLFILNLMVGFLGIRFFRFQGYTPSFVHVLEWSGYVSLSLLSFSVVCFLITDFSLALTYLAEKIYSPKPKILSRNGLTEEFIDTNRRGFLFSSVFAVSLLLTGKSFYNSRMIPKVKKVSIPIKNLHPDLNKFTIVQLTDFHIGQTIGREYVENVIKKVNELEADIVVITGDLIDGLVHQIKHDTEPLSNIKSKQGFYYVTGNHEYYWNAQEWIDYIKRIGGIYLENENKIIKIGHAQVLLAGVSDLSSEKYEPHIKSDPQKAILNTRQNINLKILLAHQPQSAFTAAEAGFDVQLSGHTHGGQFWPWSWVIYLTQPFVAGLSRYKNMWIYVSRGTGYWGPPARLGSESEITHIVFQRLN